MIPYKPILYGVGGVTLAGVLLLGWGPVSSYVRTGARLAGENARQMVPTDFEVERLETMIGDLDQTVQKQRSRLVEQGVDLDYLRREVVRAEEKLADLSDEVTVARSLLAAHRPEYRIGGEVYGRTKVVREARRKAESLVRLRAIAEAKRESLEALENALGQAEAQIAAAREKRQQYAMRLAELRASAENVAIRQQLATRLGDLPDGLEAGAFQEVEETFARIEKELEVQDRILDERYESAPAPAAIRFTEDDPADIVAQLDAALGTVAPAAAERLAAEDAAPRITFDPPDSVAEIEDAPVGP